MERRNLLGFTSDREGMGGFSPPIDETEGSYFESPYDPESLQYRLAKARSMQGERPPLQAGGTRRERAVAGLRSSVRGIQDLMRTRSGERMEKNVMADMLANREMMKTYKHGIAEKANKIFAKLYDTDTTNDKEAIKKLYQMSFNAKISFGDDFGIGKFVDEYIANERAEAAAKFQQQPKQASAQEQYERNLLAKEQSGTLTESEGKDLRVLRGLEEPEEPYKEETITDKINRLKYEVYRNMTMDELKETFGKEKAAGISDLIRYAEILTDPLMRTPLAGQEEKYRLTMKKLDKLMETEEPEPSLREQIDEVKQLLGEPEEGQIPEPAKLESETVTPDNLIDDANIADIKRLREQGVDDATIADMIRDAGGDPTQYGLE